MDKTRGVRINGNTYRCNSRILRKQLQDNAMSDGEIEIRCRDEKRLVKLCNLHNERLAEKNDTDGTIILLSRVA